MGRTYLVDENPFLRGECREVQRMEGEGLRRFGRVADHPYPGSPSEAVGDGGDPAQHLPQPHATVKVLMRP